MIEKTEMVEKQATRTAAAASAPPQMPDLRRAPEARIVEELDAVVKNAHREKLRRRALRAADRALTGLAERLVGAGRAVPVTPPSHLDLPPETRFPFF